MLILKSISYPEMETDKVFQKQMDLANSFFFFLISVCFFYVVDFLWEKCINVTTVLEISFDCFSKMFHTTCIITWKPNIMAPF